MNLSNHSIKSGFWFLGVFMFFLLSGCRPEMPVTSSITIDADGLTFPVNKNLYGVSIEEINHAVDGGIYAELIQNRSFEDGVLPLHSAYDYKENVLVTPNGYVMPFVKPDSVIGWRTLTPGSKMYLDTRELINEENRRSLLVAVSANDSIGRGGIAATGYKGISLVKGEKYVLSFYLKGTSLQPKEVHVALEDSAAKRVLSNVMKVNPTTAWRKVKFSFTALEDVRDAVLTFTSNESQIFWIDIVSLFPEKTWKGMPNGLRPDLADLIAGLKPRFIRFPGGDFVEGFTGGTFPVWHETIGDIAKRKHFWTANGYGTTNGMGYFEYLRFCESIGAEPIYVINSGVTSQKRRPRFEDITAMDIIVQDALDAIAFANAPRDSAMGKLRASQGHPEPFNLRFIEIGSGNYGTEYVRRYELFKEAIHKVYPRVTVIGNVITDIRNRVDWVDSHYYGDEMFFITNQSRFDGFLYAKRQPPMFIGEFGLVRDESSGTLRSALAEACFLLGLERNPDAVKRIAYAPALANEKKKKKAKGLILFNNKQAVKTPSYHMLSMLGENRGDAILKTAVTSYERPQVTFGAASLYMFDNSFEFRNIRIDGNKSFKSKIVNGGWKFADEMLVAEPNKWNYIMMGDSTEHDYTFTTYVRRTKGSGQIQIRVRDNGLQNAAANHVCFTIGLESCELYRMAGFVKDKLTEDVPFSFVSNQWYKVSVTCKDDIISCYVDDKLVQQANLRPIPSLVVATTRDDKNKQLILKVVNTTRHPEKTQLNINGISVGLNAEIIELAGDPEIGNNFSSPDNIIPVKKTTGFSLQGPMVYEFPPNSLTIMRLKFD